VAKVIRFIRKFFFLINLIFVLYSLLVYQLILSVDIKHWLGGFLMLSFPVVLFFNIFFVFCWIFTRSWKFLISAIFLAITYPIINRTIKILPENIDRSPRFSFSLTSYNLMYSDYAAFATKKDDWSAVGILKTLDTLSSDIKCFQELYNDEREESFDVLKHLSKRSPYYIYMHSSPDNLRGKGEIGLAIFSRFPIISKKEVYWKMNNNGLLAADIVVDRDTIRVINVQLQSMGIRVQKVFNSHKEYNPQEARNVLSQLKHGFENRAIQVNELETWISESPYPVIVAGDFNELPYGYAYGRIRRQLNNAFEENGFGFGFTYHKILGFLRIDNQFYDPKSITNVTFNTYRNVPYSDHYPIKAWYLLH
jgi:endonuclease/exonuclease/phosphatase family metal-dependent hydrolase